MPTRPTPIRKGVVVCFTLDPDAEALLRALQPNGKGIGLLVSELIRREARERVARPQWISTLAAMHTGDDIVT